MGGIIASVALTLLITILAGVEFWSVQHWAILILVPLIVLPIASALNK